MVTKENVKDKVKEFPQWRKKVITRAMRMIGKFDVETPEGTLTCCDGYLAIDSRGWPYPIDKEEFENIYEEIK